MRPVTSTVRTAGRSQGRECCSAPEAQATPAWRCALAASSSSISKAAVRRRAASAIAAGTSCARTSWASASRWRTSKSGSRRASSSAEIRVASQPAPGARNISKISDTVSARWVGFMTDSCCCPNSCRNGAKHSKRYSGDANRYTFAMNSPKDDVLVLGGGVIGLACALALRRAGASVRVLEQAVPGHGASHGNCGTLTPSHAIPLSVPGVRWKALRWMAKGDAPLYINPRPDLERWRWLLAFARRCRMDLARRSALARCAILQRSHALLPQWLAEEGIDCDFTRRGTLYVFRDARTLQAERADVEWLHELGLTAEVLDAQAVLAMEPALKPGVVGGVLHPDDAQLRPDKWVTGLARRVRERGGVIETEAQIEGFDCANGRINAVRTSRGSFAGERIVFALGAWSPRVARQLGMALPMQPGKGYSITTSRPDPCPRTALDQKSVV